MSASFDKHTRTHACTVAHVLKSSTRTLTCTAVLCFSYILFDRSANLHQKPNPIGSHLQKNSIYDILIRVRRNLYASTKAFLQNIATLKVAQQFKWSNSVRLVKHNEECWYFFLQHFKNFSREDVGVWLTPKNGWPNFSDDTNSVT